MPSYTTPADLEFIDGFQHYSAATHGQKYNAPGAGFTIVDGAGRFGAKALVNGSSSNPMVTFRDNYAQLWMGCAFKFTSGFVFPDRFLFNLRDNHFTQSGLIMRGDGHVEMMRGNANGTSMGVSGWAAHNESWDYYELRLRMSTRHSITGADEQNGSFEVRVNEATVLTGSGLTTRTTANAYMTNLISGSSAAPEGRYLNDLYVHTTGFLGDVRIGAIVPDGTGPHQAWTPSRVGTHWDLLNEVPPDGDGSYVSAETVGSSETNEMQDVTLLGECRGIQMLHSSRKTEANVRKLKHLLQNGAGVEYDGIEDSIGNSYIYYRECLDVSPFSGLNFTEAEINAFRYGVKLTL